MAEISISALDSAEDHVTVTESKIMIRAADYFHDIFIEDNIMVLIPSHELS